MCLTKKQKPSGHSQVLSIKFAFTYPPSSLLCSTVWHLYLECCAYTWLLQILLPNCQQKHKRIISPKYSKAMFSKSVSGVRLTIRIKTIEANICGVSAVFHYSQGLHSASFQGIMVGIIQCWIFCVSLHQLVQRSHVSLSIP